jgi:microtubule-associated protein-like 6
LLAGGNNNGKVCIYNFPCTIKNSGFVEGKGHSSHITNVRWNETDEYIVSVGG